MEDCVSLTDPATCLDCSGTADFSGVADFAGVLSVDRCLRSAIRCTSDPLLVRDSPDDAVERCVSERTESVASGVRVGSVDGLGVTCRWPPILGDD